MAPRRQSPLSQSAPIFVNREGPIELFETELLKIPKETASLLVFYGQGGQGKTHLCRELFRRSDYRVNPKFDFIKRAHLDLHDRIKTDPDRALIWIRNAFAAQDLSFPTFDLAFLYYWEQVRKEEALPGLQNAMFHNAQDAAGDAGVDIGQFLGDLWRDAIDTVPGVKTIYKWVSKKGLKTGRESWLKLSRPETLKALFNDRGRVLDAHIIKQRLPWFLAQDLNHYLTKHPQSRLVLLIDEYERITPEGGASTVIQENPFDTVFRQFVTHTNGLLAAFFTRERLAWERDADWEKDLKDRQILLGGLKDSDAEKWLDLEDIMDANIRNAMINGARETSAPKALIYPLLLDLQIEHYRARIENEQEVKPDHFTIAEPDFKSRCQTLLQRVLRDYKEPMQSTLKRLCVADRFDKDAFAHVITDFQTGLSLDRFDRIKTMSFITEDEGNFLLIHRAIRDVMLNWLDEDYKDKSIRSLLTHYEARSAFDPLLKTPDTEIIALNQALELRMLQDPKGIAGWFRILEKPFEHRARYSDLETNWRRLLDFLTVQTEEFPEEVASSYNSIAFYLNTQGRYDEAEPLFKKGLNIRKRVLGEDHPDTAHSYNNVAYNLDDQGRYGEAEPLFKKSLDIRERVLGGDHPSTASSYNNYAHNLNAQGRYAEAETLYRKGLDIRERILGGDHPNTAESYNNVGYNLNHQGRYEEAELLLKKDLDICERILGEDHPDTARSYNNVAYNLSSQGRYKEAESLFKKSLDILDRIFGEDHPDTASSYDNIALNLHAQGRYAEAEPHYRKGLDIRERLLGEDHPDTAESYNNVGNNLNYQGRYEEAEPLCKKALDIFKGVWGEDHPNTATSYNNIAGSLYAQGRYAEAEVLFKKSFDIRARELGKDHPDTASSYNNIASSLTSQGRYEEAESFYKKSLDICERTLGPDHPQTTAIRANYEANKRMLE